MNWADLDLAALLPFIAVGFAAQLVDGALGMAFGVISSTLLVSVMGVPPATASAGVHIVLAHVPSRRTSTHPGRNDRGDTRNCTQL